MKLSRTLFVFTLRARLRLNAKILKRVQYADALQVYERVVELDPQEVRAWERMAEIYASFLGDKK